MKKLLFVTCFIFIGILSKSQKAITSFNYTDYSDFITPKNYLSGLNYLYSVGKKENEIMAFSLNLLTNKKDSSIINVADSFKFTKLNFFTDSFYVEVLKSKVNKKNTYILMHNFIAKNTSIEFVGNEEKEENNYLKAVRIDNKFYKLYLDKKTSKIDFVVSENLEKINITFNTKEVLNKTQISESRLFDFIKEVELNVYNDIAYFLETKEKKYYEVVYFNLKTKEVNYNKIKRSQDLCSKEPNGIFYSDATFFKGNIYSTVCCRHNANLFIYDANNGQELKHFALNSNFDTSLRQSHLFLEHYNTADLENLENKEKFFTNLDTHPLLIDVSSYDDNNTVINFGTRQKEKIINGETIATLAGVMTIGVVFWGLSLKAASIFNYDVLFNYNSFYPRFYNYHQDITTAKYFSLIIDKNTTNINLNKTNELYDFKQNNRPFSDKFNNMISFKIRGNKYTIKFEDNDRTLTILQN